MKKMVPGRGPNDDQDLYRGTSVTGSGLFLSRPVKKGAFLAPFDGPTYNAVLDGDLPPQAQGFPIQIGPSQMRDAVGLARWCNHSCQPNCGLRLRSGWYWIYSRRPIAVGEEITIDYAMSQWRDDVIFFPPVACVCGSVRCRGLNLGAESLPVPIVREYQAESLFTAYNLAQLRLLRGL